jgi:hypothetical protein
MCTVRTERSATPSPVWGRLYGIVLASGALGFGVDGLVRPGAAHDILEGLVVIAAFSAMLLWVRANRVALDTADTCDCAAEHLQIRVVESPPERSPRRLPREIDAPVPVEASR